MYKYQLYQSHYLPVADIGVLVTIISIGKVNVPLSESRHRFVGNDPESSTTLYCGFSHEYRASKCTQMYIWLIVTTTYSPTIHVNIKLFISWYAKYRKMSHSSISIILCHFIYSSSGKRQRDRQTDKVP